MEMRNVFECPMAIEETRDADEEPPAAPLRNSVLWEGAPHLESRKCPRDIRQEHKEQFRHRFVFRPQARLQTDTAGWY